MDGSRHCTGTPGITTRRWRGAESAVEFYSDPQSNRIARVEVAASVWAEVEEGDWLRVRRDYGPLWNLRRCPGGHHYVVVQRRIGRDSPIAVARAIMCATGRQRVSYRDGNALNLRRSNLFLIRGAPALSVPPGGYRNGVRWDEVLSGIMSLAQSP